MKTDSEILIEIEHLFESSNWEEAKSLLQPLIDREVPAAIRMGASHFNAGLSEEEMDQIYVAGISRAAELGDPEARYILGAWYDVGDYGFEVDQEKASLIFAELAREGDLHCVWINACDHLWGRGAFDKNVELGLSKVSAEETTY